MAAVPPSVLIFVHSSVTYPAHIHITCRSHFEALLVQHTQTTASCSRDLAQLTAARFTPGHGLSGVDGVGHGRQHKITTTAFTRCFPPGLRSIPRLLFAGRLSNDDRIHMPPEQLPLDRATDRDCGCLCAVCSCARC